MSEYLEFIGEKHKTHRPGGFNVPEKKLPKRLFAWQKRVVAWACGLGRAALFLDTGMGKTGCQLAWADQVAKHTGKPVLILCPLAVGPQTVLEADKFSIKGVVLFDQDRPDTTARIVVTNYQKLHLIDADEYAGVVLDESSILKSFTGTIKRELCERFESHQFRLACTATPAPNDHMELGNHSQFLGVMESTEMLTRWFINDLSQAGVYRLKRHAEADYWRWVASWAACASKPSDLGGDDTAYSLPPLTMFDHEVADDVTAGADGELFISAALTATTIHQQKRKTAAKRAAKVAELVAAEPARPWLIWCDTDYEADELAKVLPNAVEVRGSMSDKLKEDRLVGFSQGKYPYLITKPTVAGFGMNWQHCDREAFVGVSYSFEQFYQALRRCWRYGQHNEVHVHVVCASGEFQMVQTIRRKQQDFDSMRSGMAEAAREHWTGKQGGRVLSTDYTARVESGNGWEIRLGDCVQEVKHLDDASIDFSIHSPPFSNLYIYSDSAFDMGNAADHDEFFKHYGYLVPELLRVTVPGRLAAVHCKDLPLYRNRDGVAGLYPFPDEINRLFISHGWTYHSRVTIWKCPVTEMERTKNHGLLHKTVKADSSAVRQGMADYLLVFRKPPSDGLLSDKPVSRETGFSEWHGAPEFDPRLNDYHPSKYARKGKRSRGEQAQNDSIRIWQRMADPVWWHIDQQDVLNYQLGKDDKDEKHICPLQLGVIREAVGLWTNPGDTVLSPFAGIGSEGYESVRMGRRFVGVELKESYFEQAVRNLKSAARQANEPSLLDMVGEESLALAEATP